MMNLIKLDSYFLKKFEIDRKIPKRYQKENKRDKKDLKSQNILTFSIEFDF